MNWILAFFSSSIGKKIIVSLTGIFLILFLAIHLAGNLQLLINDQGETFNLYAKFMSTHPLIKTISYGLYFFIVLHALMGITIYIANRKAKGSNYKHQTKANAGFAAKSMALLGILILAFLFIHMGDFWFKMKTDQLPYVNYNGTLVKDLYYQITVTFSQPVFVVFYLIGLSALGLHLWHGFESAFQTLGINHKQYTPMIRLLGRIYSILIPIAFAIIPVYFYFQMNK